MAFFTNQERLVMETMENDKLTRDQKSDAVHEILLQSYLVGSLDEIGFGDDDNQILPAETVWDRQNTPHGNDLMQEIRNSYKRVKELLEDSDVDMWY